MMHVVVYWLLCILLFISGGVGISLGLNEDANMTVTGSCIEEERQALLIFKADLNGRRKEASLNDWSNAEERRNCCKWSGISCDADNGHVTKLSLEGNDLVGKISPSIKLLRQLRYLDLSGNNFQSNDIPNDLGSLTNLQYLHIRNANLSGPIPRQLGNLSNLFHLDLSSNSLRGSIPFSFGALTSLTFLDLSINLLGGIIPKSLGNCSSLVYLDLSKNLLNGSVPSLAGLSSSMESLILKRNSLQGGVPNFTGWSSLSRLSLSHNYLNGSFPDFTGCVSLRKLDLSRNRLSGDLPNSVGHVSNLEYLDVSSNSLQGVISDLHFVNLTRLTYLDMSSNSISFELSSLFITPFQLRTIKLQSCKLGPSFPVWIKSQRRFKHLDISSAGISDSVPLWFWDLPLGLTFLNLSSNELRGWLPDITLNSDQYPGIDLSNNRLEGKVPLLPSKLSSLNLSGNKLKGNLSILCHIDEELSFIDLSNNLFSGSLPDCWSKFPKLVVINLSNNNLSGKIPLSFGFLNQLEALYLRKNAFVGELPKSLKNCTKLRFVDLGENKLSGKIPAWIGETLSDLYVIVLRSNMLNGNLPPQMCWLYNLQFLDLSKNGLVGNIPHCFGNFTSVSSKRSRDYVTTHYYYSYTRNLTSSDSSIRCVLPCNGTSCPSTCGYYEIVFGAVREEFIDNALVAWKGTDRSFGKNSLELLKSIDLSNNNLSGKLPYEITNLRELVSLNLSINKLHGELPKDIGRLKSLDSLDLSRNAFSGNIPSSLSQLTFLGYLDLSNNNLSGVIPTGTQLQRFNCSSYIGNPQLRGPPLTPGCGLTHVPPTVAVNEDDEKHGDDDFWGSYYMGMGAGFAVGFWGLCGVIFLNRRCRHLLFASLSLAKDWIYVTVAVLFQKFKSNLPKIRYVQSVAEKPPFCLPTWTGMYTVNMSIVVWVFVVGFCFGRWASMTNFFKQVDTFGSMSVDYFNQS